MVLVAGVAGSGKTGVLHQVVDDAVSRRWPVLAFRVDRLESFSTSLQLGDQLGLRAAPVAALGAVAADRPCLLVVDQLDAVSFASGRLPRQLDPILELVRESGAFPAMRVLLACRQYDLDNDSRLRALVAEDGPAVLHAVGALSGEQVDAAVRGMGLDHRSVGRDRRALLSSPLHLVLLAAIADQADALRFTSVKDLLDRYYERKQRDCRERRPSAPVRFGAVIGALAEAMSARQRLSVPRAILDADDLGPDADVLASEQVIVPDGQRLAFFHEAFFDYAFARRWVARDQSLREWLLDGEQELFRRAQVRQILAHLRDLDPDRFVAGLRTCLSAHGIRVHLREVMLSVLAALSDPTPAEWGLVAELRAGDGWLASRAWGLLRSPGWFARVDAEGELVAWLGSDDPSVRGRAIEIMAAGADQNGERVAALLGALADRDEYGPALMWVVRVGAIAHHRGFFDLVLDRVRRGVAPDVQELFLIADGLHDAQPAWAAELVHAWLSASAAEEHGLGGRHVALRSSDAGLLQAIAGAADGAPTAFAQRLVPYVLEVAHSCAWSTERRPVRDWEFGERDPSAGRRRRGGAAHEPGPSAPPRRG